MPDGNVVAQWTLKSFRTWSSPSARIDPSFLSGNRLGKRFSGAAFCRRTSAKLWPERGDYDLEEEPRSVSYASLELLDRCAKPAPFAGPFCVRQSEMASRGSLR